MHFFYANAAFIHTGLITGTERKVLKKFFLVVKLAQYFVCKVNKKLASYCRQEIVILKLGKLFSQTSGFVIGRQNR